MYLYIIIFLLLVFIIYLFIKEKKLKEENSSLRLNRLEDLKDLFRKEWEEKESALIQKQKDKITQLDKDFMSYEFKQKENKRKLDELIKILEVQLKEKEGRYNEVNQDLDLYRQGKIQEIDAGLLEAQHKKAILLENEFKEKKENKLKEFDDVVNFLQTQEASMKNEIEQLKLVLEDYRTKRAAINEEIRKEEEKENYIQIHSIQLSDYDKEDIRFLLSLDSELHNKTILYKLIWSQYLQQGFKNMLHNILGNRDPRNVIYCIENIKTGKKYIGKTSAEVSKRWTEHIKTSLNIGTIKSTNIHKALYKHWDEFIFYILEEVPQTKNLSEQEKYYIEFYESNKYGYNIKAGG